MLCIVECCTTSILTLSSLKWLYLKSWGGWGNNNTIWLGYISQWDISHKSLSLWKKKKIDFFTVEKTQQYAFKLYFPNVKQLKLPCPFTSIAALLCGMPSLFKDPVFLTHYFLLMVEFCNRFGVGHRWQQPKGIPGGFGVQKPSEAHCTALMWANGNHKDLTAFWHVIGCRTCGFLSGAPLPRRGGNEKEEMVASQGSGISVYSSLNFQRPEWKTTVLT